MFKRLGRGSTGLHSQRGSFVFSRQLVRALSGRATPEATLSYHSRFGNCPNRYSLIPKTGIPPNQVFYIQVPHFGMNALVGLAASRLGFGGHRISESEPVHASALEKALVSGINVFDTASHFGNGQSERLFGKVLTKVVESGVLSREEIIVISKAGTLHTTDLDGNGNPSVTFPRMGKISPMNFHCISPQFLENQISESLDRLGLETIDLFMINCPERLLSAKNMSVHRAQIYDIVAESCNYLEKEVARGRIAGYGISSNGFTHRTSAPEWLSFRELTRVLQRTQSLMTNMVAVEFPLNLYELNGLDSGNERIDSLVEQLQKLNLFPLTQRPFYAIQDGNVRLLSSFKDKSFDVPELHSRITSLFEKLNNLETDYVVWSKHLETAEARPLIWSQVLIEDLPKFCENYVTTRYYFENKVWSSVDTRLKFVRKEAQDVEHDDVRNLILQWADDYESTLSEFLQVISDLSLSVLYEQNRQLNGILSSVSQNTLSSQDTLSKNLLRLYTSLSSNASHCTLVGMRRPEYVEEALSVLDNRDLALEHSNVERIFQSSIDYA